MLKTIVNLSLIALSICCTCFSPLSKAEKADRDKALVLNADAVSIDDVEQRYILKGEILLVKGSIVITGENADIQIDPEGYQAIHIKGAPERVASIRERREGPAEEFMQGRGKEILYDNKNEVFTLIGEANFKRLLNMQTLIFNTTTKIVRLLDGPRGKSEVLETFNNVSTVKCSDLGFYEIMQKQDMDTNSAIPVMRLGIPTTNMIIEK